MTFGAARAGLRLTLLAACLASATMLPSRASAATWARERTTPHLLDLTVIDRTGEQGWLFGREDVAGDGLGAFTPAERAIDLRSGYTATDADRLWLRAYVSSELTPDAALRVYVFIDSDDRQSTGGSASAPEIDAAFAAESAARGYDLVIGMQGGTALGGVWEWDADAEQYSPLNVAPLAAEAESGTDVDPLRVFGEAHGYLQVSLALDRLGMTPACDASLLWRSTSQAGAADLDVGDLSRCLSADGDGNRVADALEVAEACGSDAECPASGLCVGARCVYPGYCDRDADCASDERCSDADICRATGGEACGAGQSCAGGLTCGGDGSCGVCSGDASCAGGERCAASGRCIDENTPSGSGGGSEADGVRLAPGQEVQGGAATCGLRPPLGGHARAALLGLVLLLGLACFGRRRLRGAAALGVLLASPELRADIDAERFRPAVTHDGWVNAEGSAVRHPDDPWRLGLFANYAYRPLVVADGDGSLVDPIVSGRLGFDLLGSVSFSRRFALGLGLPVFMQHGAGDLSRFGVGDLRLVPKLQLLDDLEDSVGLALAAELRAPTHGGDFAGSADAFSVFPKVILDHRFAGGLRIGANAGVILRQEQSFLNVTSGNELAYAAALGYRFGGHAGKTELGVELVGGMNLSERDDEETALEALGFLSQALGPEWEVKGGVGAGVLEGYGVPTWRVFVGVSFKPTSHDGDYDGVPDSADQCPEFAEDRDGVQDTDGCPEEDADADRDGVSDSDDECPATAETINGIDDQDGCPDSGDRRVVFDDGEFTVLDTIRFNTGSAEVHSSAHTLLDQVALTLRANPEIAHIRIEGHTDDTGPREVNMALSQQRALAVKRYLVARGVSPRRLTVRSYGPDRPREVGTGSRARAQNRRVEFIVE